MTDVVKGRGANGKGSIVFRQELEYPRAPGQITYYPPEPTKKIKDQVKKDRAGGLSIYILGFIVVIIGYLSVMEFSEDIEIYAILIPLLLSLGLTFAIMYLYMDNEALAKLARTMPTILMICLFLFYIASILMSILDLSEIGQNASENEISNSIENLVMSMLNPAFFLMSAGLMISMSGGSMLMKSKNIMNEFIPGMIILETPTTSAGEAGQKIEHSPQITQEGVKLCKNCNKPLDYIEEYKRYYCYDCQEYAPVNT